MTVAFTPEMESTLWVLKTVAGLSLRDIAAELEKQFGQSMDHTTVARRWRKLRDEVITPEAREAMLRDVVVEVDTLRAAAGRGLVAAEARGDLGEVRGFIAERRQLAKFVVETFGLAAPKQIELNANLVGESLQGTIDRLVETQGRLAEMAVAELDEAS